MKRQPANRIESPMELMVDVEGVGPCLCRAWPDGRMTYNASDEIDDGFVPSSNEDKNNYEKTMLWGKKRK